MARAKYGQRGLDGLFKNFAGEGTIDPRIPGVEKNFRLTLSDNTAVAKGARRTHLYATKIYNDGRFKLLALDQPTSTSLGATDRDIVYRHLESGTVGRIEVKEISMATQRANLKKYMVQIDKMAIEMRETGQLQAWVNRDAVIPAIRRYAAGFGIPVYENVATGRVSSLREGTTRIESVLDNLAGRATAHNRARILMGNSSAAFGLIVLYQSAPPAWNELMLALNAGSRSERNLLRLGQHASYASSGGAMVVFGAAKAIDGFATVTRLAGPIATVAFLAGEGFVIAQYMRGHMAYREFLAHESGLVGGLGGAVAGAWSGAKIGSAIGLLLGPEAVPIGATIGGLLGGVGGGFGGSWLAGRGVAAWCDFQDEQQNKAFTDFVSHLYDANP